MPIREGGADLVRRILLDKVQTLDRDLALIRPFAAEVALAPGQDRARLRIDEELAHGASAEPLRVFVYDRDDVGGLAVDWNLPRPRERRAARFACFDVGLAINRHLGVGNFAHHRERQDALDEDVLLKDYFFARGTAHRLENSARPLLPVGPSKGSDDRLHVCDSLDRRLITIRPMKAQRRAPVMHDERNALSKLERV